MHNNNIYMSVVLTALIVILIGTAFRKNDSPAKQVWEYKLISVYRKTGTTQWAERYDDGKLFKYPTDQKFKELGEQGWELCSTVPLSSSTHDGYEGYNTEGTLMKTTPSYAGFTNDVFYWFKRPR